MKKLLILTALLFVLIGCGGGGGDVGVDDSDNGGNGGNGGSNPPAVTNALVFDCLDVDNDQTCEASQDSPGVFNSGSVRISGSPMPQDYMNLILNSTLAVPASVFIYSMVDLVGCADQALAFDIFDIEPGESVTLSDALWGFRCGTPAYNETVVTIYNTGHFNPWDYASVYDYPRDQAITNAVVRWENTGGSP